MGPWRVIANGWRPVARFVTNEVAVAIEPLDRPTVTEATGYGGPDAVAVRPDGDPNFELVFDGRATLRLWLRELVEQIDLLAFATDDLDPSA